MLSLMELVERVRSYQRVLGTGVGLAHDPQGCPCGHRGLGPVQPYPHADEGLADASLCPEERVQRGEGRADLGRWGRDQSRRS